MATFGPTFFPPLGPPSMAGSIEPTGWDRGVLAGEVIPGFTTVLVGGVRLKHDPKSKAGAHGSNPTTHGIDPDEPLEFEVETHTNDERERLAVLLLKVIPQPGKQARPVSFDHPSIRLLPIANVLVLGAGLMQPVPDRPGVAKIKVVCRNWSPPKTTKSATNTAKRAVRNIRTDQQPQTYVERNPPPTAQQDAWVPLSF